jgi:hypothetical protein
MEGNQHMYVRESENFVWLYNLTKFGAACSAWPIVLQSWIIDYWLFVQQSTWYRFYAKVKMSVDWVKVFTNS